MSVSAARFAIALAFVLLLSFSDAQMDIRCQRPNEVFRYCQSTCSASCINPQPQPCAQRPTACRPGCQCAQGFVRNTGGQCVRPQSCLILRRLIPLRNECYNTQIPLVRVFPTICGIIERYTSLLEGNSLP